MTFFIRANFFNHSFGCDNTRNITFPQFGLSISILPEFASLSMQTINEKINERDNVGQSLFTSVCKFETENCNDKGKIWKILENVSSILSFMEGRCIGFNELEIFDEKNNCIYQQKAGAYRTGSAKQDYLVDFRQEDFLKKSLEKLENSMFLEKTGVDLALAFYLEPVFAGEHIAGEIQHIMNWTGLEILANKFYEKSNGKKVSRLRNNSELLKNTFQQPALSLIEKMTVSDDLKELGKDKLNSINWEPPIKEKIKKMAENFDVDLPTESLKKIYKTRNNIIHNGEPLTDGRILLYTKGLLERFLIRLFEISPNDNQFFISKIHWSSNFLND
ncbi:MAG: hypothetical protein Q7K34_03545 [archaeon]|nr:hypothetical protein [archaeon]